MMIQTQHTEDKRVSVGYEFKIHFSGQKKTYKSSIIFNETNIKLLLLL